jgi:hypothetical protein
MDIPTHVNEKHPMWQKIVALHYTPRPANVPLGNAAPNGMTRITEAQLIRDTNWSVEAYEAYEYRQFSLEIDGKMMWREARLFYYHDGTGVAMLTNRREGKLLWYRFGCNHTYTSVGIGKCLHQDTCTKCGYTSQRDSSD